MNSKNPMEDYYKKIEELTKNQPLMDDRAEFILLSLIEMVQSSSNTNLGLINASAQTMTTILEVLKGHKHCPTCGMMYVDKLNCECING